MQMVILLIEHLCGHEPGLTDDLSSILEQLTKLNSSQHSRVALRARQVRVLVCVCGSVHVLKGSFNVHGFHL